MARFVIVEKTRQPIIWDSNDGFDSQTFFSIEKFDCHVVSLNNEYGGGYFTVIPISPLEYRDDWGSKYTMKIPKGMKREIKIAKQSAIDLGLMNY